MILLLPPSPPLFHRTSDSNLIPRLHSRRSAATLLLHRRSEKPPPVAAGGTGVDAFTEYSGYLFELGASEADSPTEYNISNIAAIYRRKPFVLLRRLVQIGTTLGKWFAIRYIDGITERSDLMFEVRA